MKQMLQRSFVVAGLYCLLTQPASALLKSDELQVNYRDGATAVLTTYEDPANPADEHRETIDIANRAYVGHYIAITEDDGEISDYVGVRAIAGGGFSIAYFSDPQLKPDDFISLDGTYREVLSHVDPAWDGDGQPIRGYFEIVLPSVWISSTSGVESVIFRTDVGVPEIDAASGTSALTLLMGSLALLAERRRRSRLDSLA